MKNNSKKLNDLDEIIHICEKYEKIRKCNAYGYIYYSSNIIEICNKLKAMGLNWGDKLTTSNHFYVAKFECMANPATDYIPTDPDEFYVHWDNGNIGRLQFTTIDYWGYLGDEWREFKNTLKSYNPVDWDDLNNHMVFKIEDGKRLMNDYKDICKETQEKINTKIKTSVKALIIEKKKKELEELMKDD